MTNSFGIFHKANQDEILVRRQTLSDMLELHRRVDPREQLVGWYSTWRGSAGQAADLAAQQKQQQLVAALKGGASAGAAALLARVDTGAGSAAEATAADYIEQFTLVVQDFFAEAAALS